MSASRGYRSEPKVDPLELRSNPRVGADLPVDIYSTEFSGSLPGRTRDLSVGGLCVATAGPFAFKSVTEVGLTLPGASYRIPAEGRWQREEPRADLVLTGIALNDPEPAALDELWQVVLDSGMRLARFLHERTNLHELGLEEAMALAQISRYRDVAAGATVYRQGTQVDGEDSIFLLLRGRVSLEARVRDAIEIPVQQLDVGDLFGGLPLLADVPHAESAVAESDSRLLEIDRSAFRYIRTAKPWMGYRLAAALIRTTARRLTETLTRVQDRL
ncbi:MAG: cyclic nucleotide-binding domain-containing protein [Proteobacteria bacterium]|nr:cyclic nucleotide-binding domain-containing protein [Pseudomonadota bacterium]